MATAYGGHYRTLGMAYIILGLHFIERFAPGDTNFLEVGRGESGGFLKLGR